MKKSAKRLLLLLVIAAGVIFLTVIQINRTQIMRYENVQAERKELRQIPDTQWNQLAQKKIFFAHMSVGYDLIEGLRLIREINPKTALLIAQTHAPADMQRPGFYHALLEHNGEPLKKIESMQTLMKQISAAEPDIAFMKFCYVDMYANTDVDGIFDSYRKAFRDLQTEYPAVRFVHCTVPLTSRPRTLKETLKDAVKVALGKPTEIAHNRARHAFNERLKKTYPGESVFDLAFYESITPDGKQAVKRAGATKVPFLYPQYTTDGGHLNPEGRRHLAEQLLIFLAENAK